MPMPEPTRGSEPTAFGRGARLAGPIALLLLGATLAAATWGTWPDVLIDYGRELYLPWQITAGRTLYADLPHINGPLSPYANAVWFRAFGPGLDTLSGVNLVLIGILTVVLFVLLRAASDSFAATVACGVFLSVFAFSRYSAFGSYDFVAPYSHEATHGLLLSLLGVACLFGYARSGRGTWVLLGGLALGLVFLTKLEMFVAAAAAELVGLWLALRAGPGSGRKGRALLLFSAGALLPPLAAWGLLATTMPWGRALAGTLGGWTTLATGVGSLAFYRQGMGLDNPVGNLARMLEWTARYAVVLAPGILAARALGAGSRHARLVEIGLFVLTLAALAALADRILWLQAARPLPLAVIGLLAWQCRCPREDSAVTTLRIMLLVLGALLLAKIALNARVYHYGFVLAVPATLVVTVAGVRWLPEALERRGHCGTAFRGSVLAAIAAGALAHVLLTLQVVGDVTTPVGSGRDVFRADGLRGRVVQRALEALERKRKGSDSLVVLPEGVMLNYLARLPSSVREYSYTPFDLLRVPERDLLIQLQRSPPDLLLLVHRETPEYGARLFGRDYARSLAAWVRRSYRPVQLFGDPPLREGTRFGILLLERRPEPSPPGE